MIRPVVAFQAMRSTRKPAHLLGSDDGGVIRFECDRGCLHLVDKLDGVLQQWALGNDYSRSLDLFARLLRVSAIGEEDAPAGEKQQQPIAAGITAQVTQVSGMRYDEAIEMLLGEGLLEPLQP